MKSKPFLVFRLASSFLKDLEFKPIEGLLQSRFVRSVDESKNVRAEVMNKLVETSSTYSMNARLKEIEEKFKSTFKQPFDFKKDFINLRSQFDKESKEALEKDESDRIKNSTKVSSVYEESRIKYLKYRQSCVEKISARLKQDIAIHRIPFTSTSATKASLDKEEERKQAASKILEELKTQKLEDLKAAFVNEQASLLDDLKNDFLASIEKATVEMNAKLQVEIEAKRMELELELETKLELFRIGEKRKMQEDLEIETIRLQEQFSCNWEAAQAVLNQKALEMANTRIIEYLPELKSLSEGMAEEQLRRKELDGKGEEDILSASNSRKKRKLQVEEDSRKRQKTTDE